MREQRENLSGDQTVNEPMDLHGQVLGNLTIVKGGKVYVRGGVYGNLTAADGARVHVLGSIRGNVIIEPGSKVILSGHILHDVFNRGGRLYVHATAQIDGKFHIAEGKNEFAPGAKMPPGFH